MKKTVLVLFFVVISINVFIPVVSACTIFTATDSETTWFAGNEDQRPNNAYYIIDTTGTYGVAYIATPWQQWPMVMQTGINQAGLSFDANWIPTETLNSHTERTDPGEWPVTYMMRNAATVKQVLQMVPTFNWGTSMAYQVHFADATGDAAVIHPGPDGELIATRIIESYLVSTNFNLKRLPTGDYSCNRYETATTMLSHTDEYNLDYISSILDVTHQEGEISTIYATIYDLSNLQIWLYIDGNYDDPINLDLVSELQKGDRQIEIIQLVPGYDKEDNWKNYLTTEVFLFAAAIFLAFVIWKR